MRKILLFVIVSVVGSISHARGDMNVRISPLGILGGLYDVTVDFKINDQWTLGPQVIALKSRANLPNSNNVVERFDISGEGLAVRGNYFFDKIFQDGWYFGPSLGYVNLNFDGSIDDVQASGLLGIALVGYHWMWTNFNIQLGAGAAFYSLPATKNGVDLDVRGAGLATEFSIGYVF